MIKKVLNLLIFLLILKNLNKKTKQHKNKLQKYTKNSRYASNSLKISSMNAVMFHVVVLFPSFRIWKWWRYPLTAETESIDSEKWLFDYKLQEYKDRIPNLISRRQFNDRRKKTAGLCEELCKRIAMEMDGGEEQFFVDSKPIEVCRVARGKRCKMGRTGNFSQAPDFGFCASQNTFYFGYKLHALCGLSGVIHSYDLSKASVAHPLYMKGGKPHFTVALTFCDGDGFLGCVALFVLLNTHHKTVGVRSAPKKKEWKPTFFPF